MLRIIIIIILVYTGNNNASHICVPYVLDWRRGGPWSTLRHPNPGKTYYMTDSASNIKILHIQYMMMWPFYFSFFVAIVNMLNRRGQFFSQPTTAIHIHINTYTEINYHSRWNMLQIVNFRNVHTKYIIHTYIHILYIHTLHTYIQINIQ